MEMDVEAVEQTGRGLQRAGESVATLVNSIERTVNGLSSVWEGPDARRFVSEWWPAHKATLLTVGERISGLGQSALNNAAEQRGISAGPGTSGTTPGSGDGGGSGAAPTAPAPTGPAPGAREGALPSGEGRNGYVADMGAPPYPTYRGTLDGLGAFKGECTSWAAWRRDELGLEWRVNDHSGTGHGGEMAGRMGGTTSTPPTLGAIVSNTTEGHVMIIEEVRPDGSFRVSEMNIAGVPGSVRTDRIWTPNGDGTYTGHPWGARTQLVIAP